LHQLTNINTTQNIQGFHVDALPDEVIDTDGEPVQGVGKGLSIFLGLSKKNYMWIASLDMNNRIVNEELIVFDEGDCLVLPFGTLHAGDKNREGTPTFKVFSEVFTKCQLDTQSQLWVIDGSGYTKRKQYYHRLDDIRCVV